MIFMLFIGLACNSGNAIKDCAQQEDSKERDRCFGEELKTLTGKELSKAIEIAKQMEDPIIRGAAVDGWVKDHVNEINQQKGQQLCALLDGRAMSYCQRRLSSPHLKR